jgi:NADPH:quinone reductase-like Zn-dependent oxidoreductase
VHGREPRFFRIDLDCGEPLSQTREPKSMKAVVLDGYGDADKLTVREIPRPACGDGQVTVQVRAAGVNPIDWRLRKGSLRWMLPARFPLVLGFDVAGEIVEVGAAVGEWKLGDEVLCFLDSRHGGGYAEYAVAGADVLAPKPTAVSFAEAAGVPLAASTALQALRDVGKVATGRQLLVNGAAGGVGSFAVQLGRILGARVTGTCSESNLEFVRELGAERVMDYARQDFAAQE